VALVVVLVGMLASACTMRQLTSRTTELGPSITEIEEDQILANLSRFIEPCAKAISDESNGEACHGVVPNQFVLGGGQAQVSNQLQGPNLTANLVGQAIKSLTFQDQNQWTQSWSITPVTDFADLERLRLLYAYAITRPKNNTQQFVNNYTMTLVKSVDPTARIPQLMAETYMSTTTNLCIADLPLPLPGRLQLHSSCQKSWSWEEVAARDWAHRLPTAKWVYWDSDIPSENIKHARRYGKHILYVNQESLQDFMIWILGATPNTSASAGKAGGKPSTSQTDIR
jgi:hypothetical protein